ncbi:hypothetical protein JOF41_007357 [Saccharothrix coeruleofusca]|uniref:hypothetical protein n=1 Tax=Saccharothrix coeruleofusca TaxID=33919 RepID=UPI001AE3C1D9|nr:hypothetical protein [Saccharothrix coeruleofusca]MBP2341103.1 hypothetical protein [Saccharothrix coeruleofusca]
MIKPRRSPWPYPGDTPLDRARRVATTYRAALTQLDPERAAAIDREMTRLGEPWVAPQPLVFDLDAPHRPRDLAELLGGGLTPELVRQWRARGHIPDRRDDAGRPVNTPRDVLDYQAEQRRRRADRHSA